MRIRRREQEHAALRRGAAPLMAGMVLAVAAGAQAGSAYFTGLGDLPGGSFSSQAHAISPDGSMVVGESVSGSVDHRGGGEAFVWQNGTMRGLGDLPGGYFWSQAFGVSANGSVIVGVGASAANAADSFRYENNVMSSLGMPDSYAQGVSWDGSVIVGYGAASQAFRVEQGVVTSLGDLPGGSSSSRAFAVSGNGAVVVGYSYSAGGQEAFRWDSGAMSGLGFLPGGSVSWARDVSLDGSVVVGWATSGVYSIGQAFRWEAGTMTGLGSLSDGYRSGACGVSADGSIVVGWSDSAFGPRAAFLWDRAHGMRDLQGLLSSDCGLNLTGWTLTVAEDVSADGLTIVGTGINPDGNTEAWIARLPEPATGLLWLLSMCPLALYRRVNQSRSLTR